MSSPLSDVQIANMALTRLGSSQQITAFTDSSNEAAQASLWYAPSRDQLLAEAWWPWATVWAALSQVSVAGTPANREWTLSYRFPTDGLVIQRVDCPPAQPLPSGVPIFPPPIGMPSWPSWSTMFSQDDADPTPAPFGIGSDSTGKLIYSNLPNAWARYTQAVSDPSQFAPDFADLFVWKLAKEMGFALSRSDERRTYCQKMFEVTYQRVLARHLNEAQRNEPYVQYNSEFIRERM